MNPFEALRGTYRALVIAALVIVGVVFGIGRASAAVLYVTEFSAASPVLYQAALSPPLASTTVAITASSAQSAVFQTKTKLVRLHCDVICHVQVGGSNPTATTSSARLAAGQTEYFQVRAGDRVAVILGL